jgi:hypothetical protein
MPPRPSATLILGLWFGLNRLKLVVLLVATAAVSMSACGAPPDGSGASGTPACLANQIGARFKVALAPVQHETCTFCPGGDMGNRGLDADGFRNPVRAATAIPRS